MSKKNSTNRWSVGFWQGVVKITSCKYSWWWSECSLSKVWQLSVFVGCCTACLEIRLSWAAYRSVSDTCIKGKRRPTSIKWYWEVKLCSTRQHGRYITSHYHVQSVRCVCCRQVESAPNSDQHETVQHVQWCTTHLHRRTCTESEYLLPLVFRYKKYMAKVNYYNGKSHVGL